MLRLLSCAGSGAAAAKEAGRGRPWPAFGTADALAALGVSQESGSLSRPAGERRSVPSVQRETTATGKPATHSLFFCFQTVRLGLLGSLATIQRGCSVQGRDLHGSGKAICMCQLSMVWVSLVGVLHTNDFDTVLQV